MNNSTAAKKYDNTSEIREIKMPDDKKKEKKSGSKSSLLIMTAISLLVMFTAVGLIYYYIKTDPNLVHRNNQTVQVQENNGFVNPNSIQQLENDTSKISMKPTENSTIFIGCGVGLMVIIFGAFVYVKISENKEDN